MHRLVNLCSSWSSHVVMYGVGHHYPVPLNEDWRNESSTEVIPLWIISIKWFVNTLMLNRLLESITNKCNRGYKADSQHHSVFYYRMYVLWDPVRGFYHKLWWLRDPVIHCISKNVSNVQGNLRWITATEFRGSTSLAPCKSGWSSTVLAIRITTASLTSVSNTFACLC